MKHCETMIIDDKLTDESVLVELGARISRVRLEKNLTQRDIAQEAGVGLRTVQRLESGKAGTQLSCFIRILRVLGLLQRLNEMAADTGASPMAQLKLSKKTRRRASRKSSKTIDDAGLGPGAAETRNAVSENKSNWTWGE